MGTLEIIESYEFDQFAWEQRFFGTKDGKCISYRTTPDRSGYVIQIAEAGGLRQVELKKRDFSPNPEGLKLFQYQNQLMFLFRLHEIFTLDADFQISGEIPLVLETTPGRRGWLPNVKDDISTRVGQGTDGIIPLLLNYYQTPFKEPVGFIELDAENKTAVIREQRFFELRDSAISKLAVAQVTDCMLSKSSSYAFARFDEIEALKSSIVRLDFEKAEFENLLTFTPERNEKENLRFSGKFTSSKQYCLVFPLLGRSTEYGGRQRIWNVEKRQIEEISLPRGYSTWHIMDHNGEHFWIYDYKSRIRRMAKCKLKT